ncbi:hypothetical protein FBU30_005766 [Linnemannia zychae]|nr:hypothetical protein FBU30_005766 [Linnemannia zychae]
MSITETITAPYDTITKSIQKSKVWHRKTTGGVHLHEATLCDISPDKTSNTNSSLLTITTALSLLNVNKDSEDAMSAASPSSNSSFNSTMSSPNSDETSISSVSNDNNDSTFPSKHKKKVKVCRRVINRNRCKFLGYVREIDPIPVPLEDRYSGGSIREDNDDAYVRSPEELIADEYDSMNENHWINADTFVLKDKWPKAQFHFLVLPRRLIPTLDDLTSSEGIVVVRQLAERAKIVIERESKRSPHVKFMMGFHALPINQFDSGSTLEFNPDNSAVSFMSTDLSNNQLAENTHKSWENIGSDPDDSVTTTFDNNNSSVYTLGSWETRHADFAQLKRHLRQHYLEQAQKYLPCTDSWPKENQDSLLAFDSDTSSIEAVDSDVVDRYHGDGTHDGINVCDFDCENRLMCEQSSMVELL